MSSATKQYNAGVISSDDDLPPWPVYSFVTHRAASVIVEWLRKEKVPATQIAAFQAKIDSYEIGGPDLHPGFIAGPIGKKKHLYKMKVKGNKGHMQLRPMVCYGPPEDRKNEVTMLLGAIEKDDKLRPENCMDKAIENRDILIADPKRRRREQVT